MSIVWKRAFEIAKREEAIWSSLNNASIIITGSTGLIGSQLTRTLIARMLTSSDRFMIYLPVRNIAKAKELFSIIPILKMNDSTLLYSCLTTEVNLLIQNQLKFLSWNLGQPIPDIGHCDYIVHTACSTSSVDFINKPVEVIADIVLGAREILEYAKAYQVGKVIGLSTMEVYGEINTLDSVSEQKFGSLNPFLIRSSYPEAKRLSESLFVAYANEYGIDATILRLAQTFGAGVSKEDKRVFADFGRKAYENKDIELYSDGESRNSYVGVNDAVSAILTVLAKGEFAEVYNVANDDTFCSIYEMATMVCSYFGKKLNNDATVVFRQNEERFKTFRKSSILRLDSNRLMELGWEPKESLVEMYRDMLDEWMESSTI